MRETFINTVHVESRKVVPTRFGTSLVKSYPYCLHEGALIFFRMLRYWQEGDHMRVL